MQQLEQFKAQLNSSQTESVSISEAKPKRAINYPEHIKPLKERILSGLANGCRTPESVANYCGTTDIKLINLQLGRWVSRGIIGRHTNVVSGITRYYPHDIAKEKGFLTKPQPIIRKKKAAKQEQKRSSFVMPKSLKIADEALAARQMPLWNETTKPSLYTTEFLEQRVSEWQAEARKQAHEIEDLKAKLSEAQVQLIKARQTRDVTSEVTEVMQEVIKLRATVEYLESKLFGRN
jgi:CRISPR/Cas system CSM-associated protein Csm2 small subunit